MAQGRHSIFRRAIRGATRSFRSWAARWRANWRVGLGRLGIAILILATLHLDPFGVHSAAAEQSSETQFRITAPFYRSEAQNRITVILIDDQLLDRLGTSWPLNYAAQGFLLRKVLGYSPEAVFVDLTYQRPHTSATADRPADLLDALGPARERVVSGQVPLLVGAVPLELDGGASAAVCAPQAEPARGAPRLLPEFAQAGMRPTFVAWAGCGSGYPLYLYQDPSQATPAFALYRDIFCRNRTTAGCAAARAADPRQAKAAFSKPMLVVWGSVPSPDHVRMAQAAGVPCTSGGTGTWQRLKLSLDQLFQSTKDTFTWSTERGERIVCPYSDVLSGNWLYGAYGEDVKPFIENRIVLIGTSLAGVGDLLRNPVNGQVPGVLIHAMALDNLIKYGADYRYSFDKYTYLIIEGSLLLLLLAIAGPRKPRHSHEKSRWERCVPWVSLLVWLLAFGYLAAQGSWGLAAIVFVLMVGWDLVGPSATGNLLAKSVLGLALGLAVGAFSNGGPINWAGVVMGLVGLAAFEHSHSDKQASEDSLFRKVIQGTRSWLKGRS